ncbi:hypothetical protein EXIGLDRAFT_774231 [Exidia glandulosa HHB12029]|uniref:Uncharacterized protein n=1 Tax=Exidia glandulosa HHB12029 TaxID=1314781 RepID=A0A165EFI7_EXIGL|nr:hypothetical protein EXIGLDRAFT_774231 [Exidia glandulosa HHB12029]
MSLLSLSDDQRSALSQARLLLGSVGLESLLGLDGTYDPPAQPANRATGLHSLVEGSRYQASPALPFTTSQKANNEHVVSRETKCSAVAHHPPYAIVPYPQSGSHATDRILHIFEVDPDDFSNPLDSFQYSFNENHGQNNATTPLLRDEQGNSIQCIKRHGKCSSVKTCSFLPLVVPGPSSLVSPTPSFNDAEKELFLKTLALFCALQHSGCNFDSDTTLSEEVGDSEDDIPDDVLELDDSPGAETYDSRAPQRNLCQGRLVLFSNDNRYFIRCSKRRAGAQGHLYLSGIENYDLDYLSALISSDADAISQHEKAAATRGYGPLAPCNFVTSVRNQAICSDFHRFPDGSLRRGTLSVARGCASKCSVYVPVAAQRSACPFVLVVCSGPHNHPDPAPTKTPPAIRGLFESMLRDLDWQLADATPRRLMLNGAFLGRLRSALGWTDKRMPTLAHLHPSLGNYDHVAYLINCLRKQEYPNGTGLDAARELLARNSTVSTDLHYVRAVEERLLKGKTVQFVICMFPAQSVTLQRARRITIDTAFKRVKGWYEFEIEAWDDSANASMTVARVFLNSLTREAHFEVLKCLNGVIEIDTGSHIKFSYLHGRGMGWDTVHADQHKGQAMGVGDLASWIAARTLAADHPSCRYSVLEHLLHFYMLCIAHFFRNLLKIKTKVPPNVYAAMLSLASPEPLPDFNHTIALIRSGPKAANDWLEDKLTGSPFALPALYWPKSKIPLEIWKAAPRTTNGNEQAHRSVNRDGTQLSLLAGIERGLQHDWRLLSSRETLAEYGVHTRYQVPDHFRRALRSLRRHDSAQQKRLARHDEELVDAIALADRSTQSLAHATAQTRVPASSASGGREQNKRVREAYDAALSAEERVRKLSRGASGAVPFASRPPLPQLASLEAQSAGLRHSQSLPQMLSSGMVRHATPGSSSMTSHVLSAHDLLGSTAPFSTSSTHQESSASSSASYQPESISFPTQYGAQEGYYGRDADAHTPLDGSYPHRQRSLSLQPPSSHHEVYPPYYVSPDAFHQPHPYPQNQYYWR